MPKFNNLSIEELNMILYENKSIKGIDSFDKLVKYWKQNSHKDFILGKYTDKKRDRLKYTYRLHKPGSKTISIEEGGTFEGINYGLLRKIKKGDQQEEAKNAIIAFNNYLNSKVENSISNNSIKKYYQNSFLNSFGITEKNYKQIEKYLKNKGIPAKNEDEVIKGILKEVSGNGAYINNLQNYIEAALQGNLENSNIKGIYSIQELVSMKLKEIVEKNDLKEYEKDFRVIVEYICEASKLVYGEGNFLIKKFNEKLDKNKEDSLKKMYSKTQIESAINSINNLNTLLKSNIGNNSSNLYKRGSDILTNIFSTVFGEDLALIAQGIVREQKKEITDDLINETLKNLDSNKVLKILNKRKTLQGTGKYKISKHEGFIYDSTYKPDTMSSIRVKLEAKDIENINLQLNLGFSVKSYKSFYKEGKEKNHINNKTNKIAMVSGKPLVETLKRITNGSFKEQTMGNFYLASQVGLLGNNIDKINLSEGGIIRENFYNFYHRGLVQNTFNNLHRILISSLMPDFLAGSGHGKNLANYMIINGNIINTYDIISDFWQKLERNKMNNVLDNFSLTVDNEKYSGGETRIDTFPLAYPIYNYAKRRLRSNINASQSTADSKAEDPLMYSGNDEEIIKFFVRDYLNALNRITFSSKINIGNYLKNKMF